MERHLGYLDQLLVVFDNGIRTVIGRPVGSGRPHPVTSDTGPQLSPTEQALSAALMRINHVGEVCAQALYQGQAVTARRADVKQTLEKSAIEENDHLVWCEERLADLGSRTSYLNPLWYLGSFTIGVAAGIAGDAWSLGFLAETERQVVEHLSRHLERLPAADAASRAIIQTMRGDEQRHATTAIASGARALPAPLPRLMTLCSRLMTGLSYYV